MKYAFPLLLISMLILLGLVNHNSAASEESPTGIVENDFLNPGQGFAFYNFETREGVAPAALQRFLEEEWVPALKQGFPEMHWKLIKEFKTESPERVEFTVFCVFPDWDAKNKYIQGVWLDDDAVASMKGKGIPIAELNYMIREYSTFKINSSYVVLK